MCCLEMLLSQRVTGKWQCLGRVDDLENIKSETLRFRTDNVSHYSRNELSHKTSDKQVTGLIYQNSDGTMETTHTVVESTHNQ